MGYSEIVQPIRVAVVQDEPYSFPCFPYYSPWNKTLCPHPGSDVEYIADVLIGFLNVSVQWIAVNSYDEMDNYIQRYIQM